MEYDFPFVAKLPYAPLAARKLHLWKREHGIETHYCAGFNADGTAWMAVHMPTARNIGYGMTMATSMFDLVAHVGRLLEEAGLIAEAKTEREAVEQLLEQI